MLLGQFVCSLPRTGRVEHRILRFLDRCDREVDRKRGVLFGAHRAPLRPIHIVLGPLGIDVLANLCDMCVPRPLKIIPQTQSLPVAFARRLPELVSLSLSRRAGCRNVLLKIRLGLLACCRVRPITAANKREELKRLDPGTPFETAS